MCAGCSKAGHNADGHRRQDVRGRELRHNVHSNDAEDSAEDAAENRQPFVVEGRCLDDFGGIALNAGELLRQKAAVDEEFQLATTMVDAESGSGLRDAGGGRGAREQPLGTEI